MLAWPCLFRLTSPSTIFLGDSINEVDLAGSDRGVVTGVLHGRGEDDFRPLSRRCSIDDLRTVMEDIFAWDVASEAPVPLSMVRSSRASRT